MSRIKNGGLDQYGAEPFEQQQFGTAGIEGVNTGEYYGVTHSVLQTLYVSLWIENVRGCPRLYQLCQDCGHQADS